MIIGTGKAYRGEGLTINNVREKIIGIDVQVPLLDGSHRTYVNLDNAASTPALQPVFDKVNEFMRWYSSVHRGTGLKSQISTRAYDEAHEVVCQYVGADPKTNLVIFGKNATEASNKLAHRYPFERGNVILTTLMEHHSFDLPFRSVAHVDRVRVDERGALDEDHLESLLKKYSKRVRLVVVTGASNVTGYINPLHRIAEKVHTAGAELAADLAQFAPHRAIDMRPDDDPGHIDYIVLAGHKMYAPYGTGALIGKRETFLHGDPDLVGGGTVAFVTINDVRWAGFPDKEEAGSPNVPGGVALAKTMLCLHEIGMDSIAKHEAALTSYLLIKLDKIKGITLFGSTDPERTIERVGVVAFCVKGMNHNLVAAILSLEGGIAVRNGGFCAHPYLFELLKVSEEEARKHRKAIIGGSRATLPGLVRVSFGCYNNEEEVDWFVDVLKRIVLGEYRGNYIQDPVSGKYWPEGYRMDTETYFNLR